MITMCVSHWKQMVWYRRYARCHSLLLKYVQMRPSNGLISYTHILSLYIAQAIRVMIYKVIPSSNIRPAWPCRCQLAYPSSVHPLL